MRDVLFYVDTAAASGTTAQVTIVAGKGSLGVVAFLSLYAS